MPDETYLLDMLNPATKALRFVEGLNFSGFNGSELHQSAVVKQLEAIAEAANRVSESFRADHPEFPWREIVGMRHRLVHGYTRIDVSTVWETVQNDLADLAGLLEPLIPNDRED